MDCIDLLGDEYTYCRDCKECKGLECEDCEFHGRFENCIFDVCVMKYSEHAQVNGWSGC